jgi:cyanophycinase
MTSPCYRPAALLLTVLIGITSSSHAAEPKSAYLRHEGINGALILCGGPVTDAVRDRFLELAGNEKANLVVITHHELDAKTVAALTAAWKSKGASVSVFPGDGSDPKMKEAIEKASGIWLFDHPLQKDVLTSAARRVVESGAVVGISGVVGRRWPIENLMLFTHFRKGENERLVFQELSRHPDLAGFGVGLDDKTTVIVKGRQITVLGDGSATLFLKRSATLPERTLEITAKSPSDYTWLRRCAIARAVDPFPPKEPPVPEVPKGSLVIVGGGGMPADVTKKFIDLAGGPDVLIVVLPTATIPVPMNDQGAFFKRAGAKNVVSIPATKLQDVEDPKNLELLKKAGGVWFGGGRQWHFVDAYANTKMEAAFHEVLQRGGVIGGSSAGATIQGYYLCRGSPFNNTDIICEGYERGLNFLPGVAIDQHFTQRKRFDDMTALMKTYPQLLGIGIDEATALIVRGHVADIMGNGQAHFYDRKKPIEKDKPNHESVKAGGRYDLKARKILAEEK